MWLMKTLRELEGGKGRWAVAPVELDRQPFSERRQSAAGEEVELRPGRRFDPLERLIALWEAAT
jgi:hypothetical protein